ncbi:MAG: hypothetical protein ACK4VX_01040 [Polaromonas sp.]|jgi:hypothetical protein
MRLTTFSSFSPEVMVFLMGERYGLALGTTAMHVPVLADDRYRHQNCSLFDSCSRLIGEDWSHETPPSSA